MLWLADALIGTETLKRPHIDYQRHIERAHRKRSEVLRSALVTLVSPVRKLPAVIRAQQVRAHAWRVRRAAVRELSSLSDHMLRDIGLTRGDIRRVAMGLSDSSHGRFEPRPARSVRARPGTPDKVTASTEKDGNHTGWRHAA